MCSSEHSAEEHFLLVVARILMAKGADYPVLRGCA
jgi:hypothetical protein